MRLWANRRKSRDDDEFSTAAPQSGRSCAGLQRRNLLLIAGLNMARSRARPSIWSFVRIDQTSLGRSGGLAPVSLPLFQVTVYEASG